LIDFYHAVEHPGKVAGLLKSWTAGQRKIWIRKHREFLRQGQVEKVIDAVKEICRGTAPTHDHTPDGGYAGNQGITSR